MMRSLSSAVAGLRTHQTKMDVIGNNIANVNTYGFKASRTTFADVYYQNLSGGSKASGTQMGGTNPTQIGYGASVATIDVMITQSGSASTDRALDIYIAGDGFLVSKDANGQYQYTRLGNLGFDGEGNLVDGNGQLVMGFPMGENGEPVIGPDGTIQGDALQSINVSTDILDKLTGISISNTGKIVGLLPGDAKLTPSSALPAFINRNTMKIPADSTYSGEVKVVAGGYITAADLNTAGSFGTGGVVTSVEFGDGAAMPSGTYDLTATNGVYTLKATIGTETHTYTGTYENGKIAFKSATGNKVALTVTFDTANPPDPDIAAGSGALVTLRDYIQATTTDKGGNVKTWPETGPALFNASTNLGIPGMTLDLDYDQFTIGSANNGKPFVGIVARAETGEGDSIVIGNLVLAKFRNAQGLKEAGNSYFEESFNSGEAIFVRPGLEGTGGLISGYLEMSNVDVSKEFTDMITTQRGFQANTRIVTVSDEMLQELVNLKR